MQTLTKIKRNLMKTKKWAMAQLKRQVWENKDGMVKFEHFRVCNRLIFFFASNCISQPPRLNAFKIDKFQDSLTLTTVVGSFKPIMSCTWTVVVLKVS